LKPGPGKVHSSLSEPIRTDPPPMTSC